MAVYATKYVNTLMKRDCTGDHCPTDVQGWKIAVGTVIPLTVLAAALIYFYGVRNMQRLRQKEDAINERFDARDWDDNMDVASSSTQRADSFYNNQKPGFARSTTSSSFSTVVPQKSGQTAALVDDKEDPFNYKMEEYTNSMVSVPIVKGSNYILPPSNNGDDWGYQDPVTQIPGRAHSPVNFQRNSNRGSGRI